MRFNGPDYSPEFDGARLGLQHLRIRELMLDGQWRTLAEIEAATGDPAASISAQLRHLRKKRFGSYVVEKRPRGERATGLYEYRLSVNPHPPEEEEEEGTPAAHGVGVTIANEALNCLTRIPKNDSLRKRGFQIVTDWIRRNS